VKPVAEVHQAAADLLGAAMIQAAKEAFVPTLGRLDSALQLLDGDLADKLDRLGAAATAEAKARAAALESISQQVGRFGEQSDLNARSAMESQQAVAAFLEQATADLAAIRQAAQALPNIDDRLRRTAAWAAAALAAAGLALIVGIAVLIRIR